MSFFADPMHAGGSPIYPQLEALALTPGGGTGSGSPGAGFPYGDGDQIGAAWGTSSAGFPSGSNRYGSGTTGIGTTSPIASLYAMLGALLQQLQAWMSQFAGAAGNGNLANGNGAGPTQYAQNVTLSSTGDPHLAETGTLGSPGQTGNSVNAHFDSMTPHTDLVSTGDVRGGYGVSTSTTAPNAAGITYNSSATVTTAGGNDAVTMTNTGSVSVTQFGQTQALTPGQTLTLENGATVSRNTNGSVTVSEQNDRGGSISTTLTQNGPGVDVTTQAQNLRVGGDIVDGAASMGVREVA
ncbi:MAG: hypothetical protein WCE44_01920 [Candidatus Velthaea sp.]|jgi:hypothetical protein